MGDTVRSAATEEGDVTEGAVKNGEDSREVCGYGAANSLTEAGATNDNRISDSDLTMQTSGPADQLRKQRQQRRTKSRAQKRKQVLRARANSERASSALNQAVDTARRVARGCEAADNSDFF
ncbi:hypothetical protein DVH05_021136 [Phytophthora capsici]|nr:hypothetical protein DVH05_021136 [Phytophthora capsici]